MNFANKFLVREDKWSTRYKIGFPIETIGANQFQGYSIHEFLVTIDKNNDKRPLIEQVQLQSAMKSQKFQTNLLNNRKIKAESNDIDFSLASNIMDKYFSPFTC